MNIFIDIVKTNGVQEYGSYYLKNYTYYAYTSVYVELNSTHRELGCSSAALNTDGGKPPLTFIL